jgi:hypothetical protein
LATGQTGGGHYGLYGRVPRYLFSFEGVPPEDEGIELPDNPAALVTARHVAREFAHNREGPVPKIVIFNEAGEPISWFGPSDISD